MSAFIYAIFVYVDFFGVILINFTCIFFFILFSFQVHQNLRYLKSWSICSFFLSLLLTLSKSPAFWIYATKWAVHCNEFSDFDILDSIFLQPAIGKRERARLKEMQRLKKQKIQEILDVQNAAIDADMVTELLSVWKQYIIPLMHLRYSFLFFIFDMIIINMGI